MTNRLRVGLHPDRIGTESYSEKWAEFLRARGVEVRMLNLLARDALEQATGCDGVMWRWAHNPHDKQSARRILYTIQHYLGIPVYPDTRTAWHYDEKIAQFYMLQALDAPMPQTWLFWDQREALKWAHSAPYPVVFKLSSGAGSANVVKVQNAAQAASLIHRAFAQGIFPYTMNEFRTSSGFPRTLRHAEAILGRVPWAVRYAWGYEYPPLNPVFWRPEYGYAYFQEFLPHNDFDTRISVIGNRAFGFRRMNRPNDFRASGSGDLRTEPDRIDTKCVEMAFEISSRGGFQCMSYDFLYKDGQPQICEISYAFVDWTVHSCPGHWDPSLNWIEGHMWPEEAQVEDFLKLVESSTEPGR